MLVKAFDESPAANRLTVGFNTSVNIVCSTLSVMGVHSTRFRLVADSTENSEIPQRPQEH